MGMGMSSPGQPGPDWRCFCGSDDKFLKPRFFTRRNLSTSIWLSIACEVLIFIILSPPRPIITIFPSSHSLSSLSFHLNWTSHSGSEAFFFPKQSFSLLIPVDVLWGEESQKCSVSVTWVPHRAARGLLPNSITSSQSLYQLDLQISSTSKQKTKNQERQRLGSNLPQNITLHIIPNLYLSR